MGVFEKVKGSGEWWVRYSDKFGHIHREKAGPKSLAQKAYEKRKTEVNEEKFFPEMTGKRKDMLFKDMAKLYLEDFSKITKRSYPTDCYYMRRLNQAFGEKALSEISVQDVDRLKGRIAQEVSDATVNRHLALLSGVFNKAIAWKKTKANPVREVKKFQENNKRDRYLTEEEETRLKAVFPEEHWSKVEIAFNTGLRRGEQLNLKWPDVNVHSRTITIRNPKSGEKEYGGRRRQSPAPRRPVQAPSSRSATRSGHATRVHHGPPGSAGSVAPARGPAGRSGCPPRR